MSIQDFLASATSKLGAPADQVESATGGLLGMIKEQASGSDWSAITNAIPGADSLAKALPAAKEASGGLLGGLASKAGALLGGGGGGMDILGKLASSGLSADKIPSLAGSLMDFFKDKVGASVVSNILGKIPALKSLIG